MLQDLNSPPPQPPSPPPPPTQPPKRPRPPRPLSSSQPPRRPRPPPSSSSQPPRPPPLSPCVNVPHSDLWVQTPPHLRNTFVPTQPPPPPPSPALQGPMPDIAYRLETNRPMHTPTRPLSSPIACTHSPLPPPPGFSNVSQSRDLIVIGTDDDEPRRDHGVIYISSSSEEDQPNEKRKKSAVNETNSSNFNGNTNGEATRGSIRNQRRERCLNYKKWKKSESMGIYLVNDGYVESVERILMTFDGLRRRIAQIEDLKQTPPGSRRRPNLEAGTLMMSNGLVINTKKRFGAIPGMEIGDIFFYRFEMRLIGMHTQIMSVIDYTIVPFEGRDEIRATSIVTSGVYNNTVEEDDGEALIIRGQGGIRHKRQIRDQILERGNLALKTSYDRNDVVRVVRGTNDPNNKVSTIYVYDGLYRVQAFWIYVDDLGFRSFKYKLKRDPGQPKGFALWKCIEGWRANLGSRSGLISSCISKSTETIPISIINNVDDENGPSNFRYLSTLEYPESSSNKWNERSIGCSCVTCLPGDTNCVCYWINGRRAPYTITGSLVTSKPLIVECGTQCKCNSTCKNRVTQNGIRLRMEIFKTKEKGWGLRSWDPIRAGTFICEYAGRVMNKSEAAKADVGNEYIFNSSIVGNNSKDWNYDPTLLKEEKIPKTQKGHTPKLSPLLIDAKESGNVARFMNHSCSPNVFWQLVQYGHNQELRPHVAFFSKKSIPPLMELTYDYGDIGKSGSSKKVPCSRKANLRRRKCFCGSTKCRGFFS